MKAIHHGVWLILIAALQPTLLNYIVVYGSKPNLFLVYVILAAFFCGKKDGTAVGAIYGIAFDLLTGKTVGLHAVCYMYIGAMLGMMSENVFKKPTVIFSVLSVLVSSAVMGCAEYVFRAFTVEQASFVYAFMNTVLPETLYSAVFIIILFYIIKKTTKVFSIGERVNE